MSTIWPGESSDRRTAVLAFMEGRFSGGNRENGRVHDPACRSEPGLKDLPSEYSPAVNAYRSRFGPGAFARHFTGPR